MNASFTIPNRTLVSRHSEPGELSTYHLEGVRDYLRKLAVEQQAEDHQRTLDQLHVSFLNGRMEGHFMTPTGLDATTLLLTDNGASQLAREVLPSRFFGGMKELATMDETGAKLATMVWAKFSKMNNEKPRLVRTLRMREGGPGTEIHRVIRSCHSLNYATYSNLDFVQDILDNAGDFANMPVLDWRVSDTGMRLRFAGKPKNEITLKEPIPMIEAWNSEVGLRRVGLRGGMWKLICTNGMGSWQDRTEYSWLHSGDAARISKGVEHAFTNLLTTANGVVEAYQDALDIQIDNAFEWLEAELAGAKQPERVIKAAKAALSDPTTTPGGLLASTIDAVTLVAQREIDMFNQYEIERVASRMLNKGRGIALRNDGRIPALA